MSKNTFAALILIALNVPVSAQDCVTEKQISNQMSDLKFSEYRRLSDRRFEDGVEFDLVVAYLGKVEGHIYLFLDGCVVYDDVANKEGVDSYLLQTGPHCAWC